MENVMGRIHSVESFGALDGPGIRYVLFLQGCPLRCLFCHNPDSWDAQGGQEIGSKDVVADIWRYRHFIRRGGVTLSGGEPLMQPDFAASILEGCRELGLHTAVDTSGGVSLLACRQAVDAADMLLLDMKAADDALFRALTGRGMDNTMGILGHCETTGKRVWIRHVLVPGYTLKKEQLHKLGKLLADYRCIERVELLPFHKMGEYKWAELGREYTLWDTQPPEPGQVDEARAILQGYGLDVRA